MQTSVHLAVIQALLTIATSEYFVPHGDTLVQCLKVVFNLAIATDDELVTLTAQNALLQVRCPLQTTTCLTGVASQNIYEARYPGRS